MRALRQAIAGSVLAVLAVTMVAPPAAGHERVIYVVGYWFDLDNDLINTNVVLSGHTHPGKVLIALKRRSGGTWVTVARKRAYYSIEATSYVTSFPDTGDDRTCKAIGAHVAEGHKTIRKQSETFAC
jgi:hypothetical protein